MKESFFKVNRWEEDFIIQEKIAHAKAKYLITGDLNGEIEVDYSIFYVYYDKKDIHNSSSIFKGFMLFEGSIDNKSGTFILEDSGSFVNNEYSASVTIVEGSGTGDFTNIKGVGKYHPLNDGMILKMDIEC